MILMLNLRRVAPRRPDPRRTFRRFIRLLERRLVREEPR
jgi:hypothetical protein